MTKYIQNKFHENHRTFLYEPCVEPLLPFETFESIKFNDFCDLRFKGSKNVML